VNNTVVRRQANRAKRSLDLIFPHFLLINILFKDVPNKTKRRKRGSQLYQILRDNDPEKSFVNTINKTIAKEIPSEK